MPFHGSAVEALYGPVQGVPSGAPWNESEQENIAVCTIDAWQAMGRLANIAIVIDAATEDCRQPLDTSDAQMLCSATVSSVIGNTAMLAALLASAASDCA